MASLFEKCRVLVCPKKKVDRLEATESTAPVMLSGREVTVKTAKREKKSSEPIHLRPIGVNSAKLTALEERIKTASHLKPRCDTEIISYGVVVLHRRMASSLGPNLPRKITSSDTREPLIQLKYQCWSPMDHGSSSLAPLQHHYDVLTQNEVYSICPACPCRLWIYYERVPAF